MADVLITQTNSIVDPLGQLQQRIAQRAYELFQRGNSVWGDPLADWFAAERELVWTPPVEVRRKDGQVEVLTATPGIEAKDLRVQVTPNDLVIEASATHAHAPEEAAVQVCEFNSGTLFRSLHFAEPIDPKSMKAEYRDGLLHLTATIAKVQPTKVSVKAA